MKVRAADLVVHRAGQDRILVGPRSGGPPRLLSPADLELLRSCTVLRTLRAHADAWARREGVPRGSRKVARRALRRWLDQGLLVPLPPLDAPPDPPQADDRWVHVDPSATSEVLRQPVATDAVFVTSDPNPHRYVFPAELPTGQRRGAALQVMQGVLGQPAAHLLRGASPDAPWWRSVSPALLDRLREGSARVVAACLGTAGALPEPADVLLHLPPTSAATARRHWGRARTGARLIRHAPATVLAPPDRLDALAVAVDARGVVPPLADLDGAWALFGATLGRVRPDALVAHLPWALVHTRPAPAVDPVAAHGRWRVVDVLIDAVRAPLLARSLPPRGRLDRLAQEVAAQADLRHLDRTLADRWRRRCAQRARRLRAQAGGDTPWHHDLNRALSTLHDALLADPPVPMDLEASTWADAVPLLGERLRSHARELRQQAHAATTGEYR